MTSPAAASGAASPYEPGPAPVGSGFAVLLLGYGGGGHEGAYLTDAMMVVIGDPERKTVALLSLPRDIWAPVLYDGSRPEYSKLNTAYAYGRDSTLHQSRLARYQGRDGAGVLARDTVARLLGIPVDSYFALDFAGFRNAIDAVGGIDVVVPTTFAAQYPRNDDPSVDPGWKIVRFTAGPEHMTGERALQFSRARLVIDGSGEGSDFARARRQRLVINALKDRLLQPAGALRIPQALALIQKNADTDYPLPAALDLAKLVVAWGDVRIYQATLSLDNYLQEATGPDDAYILVPRAPGASWARVRAFARRLWADPALGQAMAETKVVVENRTGQAGLATSAAERLASLGYVVGEPASDSPRPTTVLRDRSGGRAGPLVEALARDLGLATPDVVSEPATQPPTVVLELGQDSLYQVDLDLPPPDTAAPASAVGVRVVGQWVPSAYVAPTATAPARAPAGTPAAVAAGPATPSPTSSAVTATAVPATVSPSTPTPAPRPSKAPSRPASAKPAR